MRIAIVGAGMAGLACAEALHAAGHAPVLWDKGRAAGGRMSTRRAATPAGEAAFDHGAQYFTARDGAFRARVAAWHAGGLVAPWPAAGPDAWVGTPGMTAPVRAMAAALDVRSGVTVTAITRQGTGWRVGDDAFDAVVVAVPAEQAAPLLAPHHAAFAALAASTRSAPCWTVMAAFADRLPVGPDVLRGPGPLAWAARNSAKPGRRGPEAWVLQAGPDWTEAHLEQEAATVVAPLLAAFAAQAGLALPEPVQAAAHRWRYARAGAAGRTLLWDAPTRLGVCGDWLIGPRVEAAWCSGTALAATIAATMGPATTAADAGGG